MAKNNEQVIRTTIRVTQKIWDAARRQAINEGMSLQDLVTTALMKYLNIKPTPELTEKRGGRQ